MDSLMDGSLMSRGILSLKNRTLFFDKGSLNTLEKAMNGMKKRLNGRTKRLVIQVVLRATNRHLVL